MRQEKFCIIAFPSNLPLFPGLFWTDEGTVETMQCPKCPNAK